MKTTMSTIALALAAISLTATSGEAAAGRGHSHYHGSRAYFGITIGAPLWYPGPYYYPYPAYTYSYPAPVIVQPAPRVYVERDDVAVLPQAAPQASPYWYYCRDTNMYYPYARECASPWERVPAQPAAR